MAETAKEVTTAVGAPAFVALIAFVSEDAAVGSATVGVEV